MSNCNSAQGGTMSIRKSLAITLLLVMSIAAGWYGCSEDSIVTYVNGDQPTVDPTTDASLYFPDHEGYTTSYNITYPDGTTDQLTFTMGKTAGFQGLTGRVWVASRNYVIDSSYIYVTADAVYFYDNYTSSGEKVLQLPLKAGHYWTRFAESGSYTYGDNYTDIITGTNADSTGSGTMKLYPSEGSSTMVVDRIEPVRLSNGYYFSNAVRISNDGVQSGTKNYYWFVPQIGLVKYVLGTTDLTSSKGDVIGEIKDYYTK